MVEPLAERGIWWAEVDADSGGDEEVEDEEGDDNGVLDRWRALIRWFGEQPEFLGNRPLCESATPTSWAGSMRKTSHRAPRCPAAYCRAWRWGRNRAAAAWSGSSGRPFGPTPVPRSGPSGCGVRLSASGGRHQLSMCPFPGDDVVRVQIGEAPVDDVRLDLDFREMSALARDDAQALGVPDGPRRSSGSCRFCRGR